MNLYEEVAGLAMREEGSPQLTVVAVARNRSSLWWYDRAWCYDQQVDESPHHELLDSRPSGVWGGAA